MKYYNIKKLSKLMSVPVKTLEYYDEIGLLKPSHTSARGQRLYSNYDILGLVKIKYLQSLGFTLEKIKSIHRINPPNSIPDSKKQSKFMGVDTSKAEQVLGLIENMKDGEDLMREINGVANKEVREYLANKESHERTDKKIIEDIVYSFYTTIDNEVKDFNALSTEEKSTIWFKFWAERYEKILLFTSLLANIEHHLSIIFDTTEQEKRGFANQKLEELLNIRRTDQEKQALIDKFKTLLLKSHPMPIGYDNIASKDAIS